MKRFSVSVPATSANLGPGFDAVGVALSLRIRADVEPSQRFELVFAPGAETPSHGGFAATIWRAMARIDSTLPRVRVRIDNRIPLGKGLGSSAAASVLGLAIAARAHRNALARGEIARLACELEGHHDNALPAVFGSVVIAARSDAHAYVRLPRAPDLRALVIVPDVVLDTAQARALLPDRYDRADAVFTAQHSALLGAALASGTWKALGAAMSDRLHQPYRAARIPGMAQALALRDRTLIGSALSGAGPSLIALLPPHAAWQRLAARLEECFARAGVATRALPLGFSSHGLRVVGSRG
jgi:homoserine kinase